MRRCICVDAGLGLLQLELLPLARSSISSLVHSISVLSAAARARALTSSSSAWTFQRQSVGCLFRRRPPGRLGALEVELLAIQQQPLQLVLSIVADALLRDGEVLVLLPLRKLPGPAVQAQTLPRDSGVLLQLLHGRVVFGVVDAHAVLRQRKVGVSLAIGPPAGCAIQRQLLPCLCVLQRLPTLLAFALVALQRESAARARRQRWLCAGPLVGVPFVYLQCACSSSSRVRRFSRSPLSRSSSSLCCASAVSASALRWAR